MSLPCYRCGLGITMPDGSIWCELTFKPASGCDTNFVPGNPLLYKPQVNKQIKQKIVKPKVTKPKIKQPLKPKPISSKKKSSQQQRLF